MDIAGWYPDVILLSANFYDALYQEAGAELAGNLFIQSQFHPLELADDEKATQDYLDLMEQHNPSGKIALLGQQIGRASCRKRVCQYGVDLGGSRIIKKKKTKNKTA